MLLHLCLICVSLFVIRSAFRVWRISSVSSTMCSITPTAAPKMHSNSGRSHYYFNILHCGVMEAAEALESAQHSINTSVTTLDLISCRLCKQCQRIMFQSRNCDAINH